MSCWLIGPILSQTEEFHPLIQGVKPFAGPELYIQPEELFQKNVDNFNLSPVVKDKLFLAFELGDHPFGLFTFL